MKDRIQPDDIIQVLSKLSRDSSRELHKITSLRYRTTTLSSFTIDHSFILTSVESIMRWQKNLTTQH